MLFQNAKPGKSISRRELRAAGQELAKGREALTEGDDGPIGSINVGTGKGRYPGDKGHWFAVRITAVEDNKYEFEEIVYVYADDVKEVQAVEGGRCAKLPHNPAVSLSDATFAVGDPALARRSYRSPDIWELMPQGGGSATRMFGRLTGKSVGLCPVYSYEEVVQDATCGDNWLTTGREGTAYEANGVDLPVPEEEGELPGSGPLSGSGPSLGVIVELIPLSDSGSGESGGESGSGTGPTCVFIMEPRWEFVEPTSEPDDAGLMTGFRLSCGIGGCQQIEAIIIIDINSLP